MGTENTEWEIKYKWIRTSNDKKRKREKELKREKVDNRGRWKREIKG